MDQTAITRVYRPNPVLASTVGLPWIIGGSVLSVLTFSREYIAAWLAVSVFIVGAGAIRSAVWFAKARSMRIEFSHQRVRIYRGSRLVVDAVGSEIVDVQWDYPSIGFTISPTGHSSSVLITFSDNREEDIDLPTPFAYQVYTLQNIWRGFAGLPG